MAIRPTVKIFAIGVVFAEQYYKARNQSQKERIAPYRPSINSKLAKLFAATIPDETEKPAATIVNWSFLDKDDAKPGEPADWVKKQIKQLEKRGDDDLHKEMLEDMKQRHRWTRNILPPNISKTPASSLPFSMARLPTCVLAVNALNSSTCPRLPCVRSSTW